MSDYSNAMKLTKAEQKFTREKWSNEERLSNSAHQREVKDLTAAGLNPVLSAGGSGATYSSTSDTSTTGSAASYLSAKIAARNNKEIAQLNYKAAMAGAAATISAARTSAAASNYAANMNYQTNKYVTDNSKSGTIPGVVEKYVNKFTSNPKGVASAINKAVQYGKRKFSGKR